MYLDTLVNYEQTISLRSGAFRLERMHRLVAALGHPERRWPAVHVAGTKGKGSTCALVAAILQAAGLRVGLYTSPHLVDLRERIQVDGRWVTPSELADAVAAVQQAAASGPHPPTFFEACTAAAFWLFARWQVQVAVVEVGLGGRLDATNVLDPMLSVITPISRDHTGLLGDTVAAIAGEKAGIIKPGRPVVVAPQPREAQDVIVKTAEHRRAPWVAVTTQAQGRVLSASVEGQRVVLQTPRGPYPPLQLPLLGAHQVVNLATAVTAVEQLPASWPVSPQAVVEGAASVQCPGRLQIVARRPWLVVDGAHNAASAQALRDAVQALWPGRPVHLVLGCSAEKDVDGIARALQPLTRSVVATQAQHPRALPARRLADRLRPWFAEVAAIERVPEAVAQALAQAAPDDCVVVTGSFFVIGELLQQEAVLHG